MKKILFLAVLAVLSCLGLTACGSTVEKDIWVVTYETDNDRDYTYEDIKVDEKGNIISKKEGPNLYTYEYNEDGLLVREIRENSLYGIEMNKYEYDENGLMVRSETSDEGSVNDGKVFNYSYTYDEEGKVTSMLCENANAEWSALVEYTYDEEGRIATATEHSSDVYLTEYFYDANGNVIKTFTTSDGWTRERNYEYQNMGTYEYDEKEEPLAEKYRDFRNNHRK